MPTPIFDMTDSWVAGAITYTAVKMNVTVTGANPASKLIDLQVGGVTVFNVGLTVTYTSNFLQVGPIGGNIAETFGTATGGAAVGFRAALTSVDPDVNAVIAAKNSGGVQLQANGALQAVAQGPAGTTRYIQLTGSVAGNPTVQAGGGGRVEIADLNMTGGPTAPTPAAGDNDTSVATTAFVTGAIREKLTANRGYFVRTDGSDSNTGLVNSAGGAFLTIQKAIDVAAALDMSIFNVTINVAAGTYGAITLKSFLGAGTIILNGDNVTPTNCVIGNTTGIIVTMGSVIGRYTIQGFHIKSTNSNAINVSGASILFLANCRYEAANIHISATTMAQVTKNVTTIASGNAGHSTTGAYNLHIYAETQAFVRDAGHDNVTFRPLTIIGTPAQGQGYILTLQGATVISNGNVWSGTATGVRATVQSLSYVFGNGAGAAGTYFPGNGSNFVVTGGVLD